MIASTLLFIPPQDLGTPPMSDSPWALLPTASNHAANLDALYVFLTIICGIAMVITIGAQIYFMVKYKKRSDNDTTSPIKHNGKLEFWWSAIPAVFLLIFFVWGEMDFMRLSTPPTDAMQVNVKAKQWSWEFTYPGRAGQAYDYVKTEEGETIAIPTLIVPLDEPVRMMMQSQDVIHSFYVPAFRVKKDVVPGRYTSVWFKAIQEGEFPLFCTEYCGDEHSSMIAKVKVVKPEDFEAAVAEATKLKQLEGQSLEDFGKMVYGAKGCDACHTLDGTKKVGPSFKDLWGKTEQLADGTTVKVDENYFAQSIYDPNSQIVAGYPAQMPSFAGQINDEQRDALIAFLKSLSSNK